ncbi:hypothetical protein N0V85_004120 [Neurospora sp. IMI 360204]|nr:hypothetical protein N0V85_004120 [Neurospora sp. IMI 360204]
MVVPITKLSMKPLNAEPPKTEPFPPVVARQPMEITSAPGTANASTAPPEAMSTGAETETETETETEKGVKRSQSKRLSKNPGPGPGASKKNTSEAYNAFWKKLIGITPKGGGGGDKGKGKGKGRGKEEEKSPRRRLKHRADVEEEEMRGEESV